MMISLLTSQGAETLTAADLSARLVAQDEGSVIWVDITGPSDDDVYVMHDVFHFHPLAIEDTRNVRQRPKVEEYADYMFFILNPVGIQQDETIFCELDVFVGRNYVVTVHAAEEPVIAEVSRRVSRGNASLPMSPGYLAYLLLDAVVDSYFPVLDTMEEEIEALGDQILTHPTQDLLNRLFDLKKALVDMWRVVWPQREILNNLRDHNVALINQEQLMPYLRDISDHLMWIADMVSTFRDTLTGIIDLYMSAVSNRLNRVVNRLTVFTVIIGVLTVIGGFYGMNFEHTWPPFSGSGGVPFVILLMGTVTAALLYIFRRLKWY
jgi:magnesium transporter